MTTKHSATPVHFPPNTHPCVLQPANILTGSKLGSIIGRFASKSVEVLAPVERVAQPIYSTAHLQAINTILCAQNQLFNLGSEGMALLHACAVQTSVRERHPSHGSTPAHNENTKTNRLLGLYPPLSDLQLNDGLLNDQREIFRATVVLPRPVITIIKCTQELLHIGSSASPILAYRAWPHSFIDLTDLLYSPKRRLNRLTMIASMRAAEHRQIERGYLTSPEQETLVVENQRLVGFVAKSYTSKGLSWYELCSAGYVGLVIAAREFDPSRGRKFSTCAVPWIKGEITAAFKKLKSLNASDRNIRATANGVPLVFDAESEQKRDADEALQLVARKDLDKQNDPEGEELTDHIDLREAVSQDAETTHEVTKDATGCEKDEGGLGYSAKQARSEGIGSSAGHALEDVPCSDDAASDNKPGSGASIEFVGDTYQPQLSLGDVYDFPEFKEALDRLEPRQALVVRMRLGLDGHSKCRLEEIGSALDVTTQRANAIFQATFEQLINHNPNLRSLFEQTI